MLCPLLARPPHAQWCSSTTSDSRKAKNCLGLILPASSPPAAGASDSPVEPPSVGSCASNFESSPARSVGRAGGWGAAGAEKVRTAPTCASAGWRVSAGRTGWYWLRGRAKAGGRKKGEGEQGKSRETDLGSGLVALQLRDVEVLDEVYRASVTIQDSLQLYIESSVGLAGDDSIVLTFSRDGRHGEGSGKGRRGAQGL